MYTYGFSTNSLLFTVERIFKTSQHLAKLDAKTHWQLFSRHGVQHVEKKVSH